MEWLTNKGEVYHRACTGWSTSIESGKCQHCESAIPEAILRLARSEANDCDHASRNRNLLRKTKAISQRFAEMQARTEATLRRASPDDERAKKG